MFDSSDDSQSVSRRSFLARTGAGLTGLSALDYASLSRGMSSDGTAPNEQIVMGFIGVGGMGKNRLTGFLAHEDVTPKAICDVDARHVEEAVALVEERRDRTPERYHDFRNLLEDPEIDAVTVVTPDHWHAIPTVRACEAGKDVFVEKPLSYSVYEGRRMVEAAEEHERVTQMGNHIHNDLNNYRRVVERIRSGQIGRVTRVHLWKRTGTEGRGSPANQAPPDELDYDFWLGPAPDRPYNPLRSHFTFRYFWDYSGGVFIDFWCHIADVAYWALDLTAPRSVSATGGRYYLEDGTETPQVEEATYEYSELLMTYTVHPDLMPGYEHMGGIGAIFLGTEGTLVTNYSEHELYRNGEKVENLPEPAVYIPNSPGHLREFLDGVKSRDTETTCNVAYGHRLSKAGLLGNIAYRTESTVHWNEEEERIEGNPSADDLLRRSFRHPWTLSLVLVLATTLLAALHPVQAQEQSARGKAQHVSAQEPPARGQDEAARAQNEAARGQNEAARGQNEAARGQDEAFTSLFNGEDLTGWVEMGEPGAFVAEDGTLFLKNPHSYPNWLRSRKRYENFVLELEYMTPGWSEAGIYLRAPLYGNPVESGLKLHLRHSGTETGSRTTGGIFDVQAPLAVANREAGEWNDLRIRLDGPQLSVWMNDTLIQRLNLQRSEDLRWRLRQGYLGFEDAGQQIRYRDVRIRELPDTEPGWTALFDGDSLEDWKVRGEGTWTVRGDTLVASGDEGGYLVTDGTYGSFEFRTYFKAEDGANGGIFYRMAERSDRRDDYEIQIYNVPTATNPTGSIYDVEPASDAGCRNGDWCFLRLISEGAYTRVLVNGETVAEKNGLALPDSGRIGIQNHSSAEIRYRKIRVRALGDGEGTSQ